MKITVSSAVSETDLHTPDMNRVKQLQQQLRTDALRVLSSVIIIAQRDTKNIEYLISWLQKVSLE